MNSDNIAIAKDNSVRSSLRKLNLVAQSIKNMKADKAVNQLKFNSKRISKTVLNALTHVRNFISAGAFVSANGLIVPTGGDYSAIFPKGGEMGVFGKAREMSVQRLKGKVDPSTMNLIQRSTRVGVGGGTNIHVGEYTRSAEDLLSARAEVFTMTMLGFALVEAIALFALVIALVILFG